MRKLRTPVIKVASKYKRDCRRRARMLEKRLKLKGVCKTCPKTHMFVVTLSNGSYAQNFVDTIVWSLEDGWGRWNYARTQVMKFTDCNECPYELERMMQDE